MGRRHITDVVPFFYKTQHQRLAGRRTPIEVLNDEGYRERPKTRLRREPLPKISEVLVAHLRGVDGKAQTWRLLEPADRRSDSILAASDLS